LSNKPLDFSFEGTELFGFTLPDNSNAPACSAESEPMDFVSLLIPSEFLHPVPPIALWQPTVFAAAVLMPETTMHEYCRAILWKHDVGPTW